MKDTENGYSEKLGIKILRTPNIKIVYKYVTKRYSTVHTYLTAIAILLQLKSIERDQYNQLKDC